MAERRCSRSEPASMRSWSTFSSMEVVCSRMWGSVVVSLQTWPQR